MVLVEFGKLIHIMALFITIEVGDVTQVFADSIIIASGVDTGN